jgi:hypothetical protein
MGTEIVKRVRKTLKVRIEALIRFREEERAELLGEPSQR